MADPYSEMVGALSRVPGVLAALVVDAEAGVPIMSETTEGIDGAAVAALAASLFKRSTRGIETAEFGRLGIIQLEANEGHVLVAGAGDLMVVAVTDVNAQLGMVRLAAQRAAAELS